MSGDMCEDLCVLGLVEYKRCLYYENGKKVIEAHWRGKPIILKSKLENFSSYEPLGILDYQVMFSRHSCASCPVRLGSAESKITGLISLSGHSRGPLPSGRSLLCHTGSKFYQSGAITAFVLPNSSVLHFL